MSGTNSPATASTSAQFWRLRMASASQLCALAVYWTFYGVQMKNNGLGENEIGTILAICTVFMGVMGIAWSRLAVIYKRPVQLVLMSSVLCSVGFVLVPLPTSFYGFLGVGILVNIAISSFFTLMPVLVMNQAPEGSAGSTYGRYRIYGSLGFLVGTFGLGAVAKKWGLNYAFYVSAIIALLPITFLFLDSGPRKDIQKSNQSVFHYIRDPRLVLLMLVAFCIAFGQPSNFPFLAIYAKRLGADIHHIAWITSVNGIVAVIALPITGMLADKKGARLILLLAVIAQPLRSLGYSFVSDNYWFLMIPQIFHFFTWAAAEICFLMLVGEIVGKSNRQMVYSLIVFTQNLSIVLANKSTGWLAESYGYPSMYRIISATTALGIIFYLILYFRMSKSTGKTST